MSHTISDTRAEQSSSWALVALFLLGALIRVYGVSFSMDQPSWRECDIASIARNFYREGMNPAYPRIDWRGDGPGYAEMEFPVLPWLMALSYHVVGIHESVGRWIEFGFSLIGMAAFLALARRFLPPLAACAAGLFFALSPLAVEISTSLQPDGLMFAGMLVGLYALLRWIDQGGWRWYFLCLIATALAILAKAPAAHIGLVYAGMLLWDRGLAPFRQVSTWLLGVGTLLPAVLWYLHARHFWLEYGNSLGLSNESHWIGLDSLLQLSFVGGIGRNELDHVWTVGGAVVGVIGLLARDGRAKRLTLLWLAAVALYLFIAGRTAGDGWAYYYHVVAVPPVALAFGLGVQAIAVNALAPQSPRLAVAAFTLAICAALGIISHWRLAIVAGLIGSLVYASMPLLETRVRRWLKLPAEGSLRLSRPAAFGVNLALVAACATPLALVGDNLRLLQTHATASQFYTAAQEFAPLIPPDALIVASGGPCHDPTGKPVAYNAPYFFYWLDRKGFNVCTQCQSLEHLTKLARRGALYFVAEKNELRKSEGLREKLDDHCRSLRETDAVILYDLSPLVESVHRPAGGTLRAY